MGSVRVGEVLGVDSLEVSNNKNLGVDSLKVSNNEVFEVIEDQKVFKKPRLDNLSICIDEETRAELILCKIS